MFHKILIAVTLIIFSTSCGSNKIKQEPLKYFRIEIIQNNKVQKIKNGVVTLKKAPFQYRVTLNKIQYLDVSASFGKYYYDFPQEKNIYECNDRKELSNCRFFAPKTAAEYTFNEPQKLLIAGEDLHLNWFYDSSMDWHRYDKGVTVKGDLVIAKKTIAQILELGARDVNNELTDYNYPIEKISNDIYMVFATSQLEDRMDIPKELQREKFIIKFK